MTADHFFIARRDIAGARGRIAGAEHHHLSRVARLHAGDTVRLFDECGALYSARVEKIGPGATELVILTAEEPESPRVRITLGQAVLKAKAMEEVVEKAAELGVFAIAPFLSRRSVVKPGRGGGSPTERWARIALAAAKQSHSGRLPHISAPVPLPGLPGRTAERGEARPVRTGRDALPRYPGRTRRITPGRSRPSRRARGRLGAGRARGEPRFRIPGREPGPDDPAGRDRGLFAAAMALHFWND